MNTIAYPLPLTVEFTPRSVSGKSLSTMLTADEWDHIRHDVYAKYAHTCPHCSAPADRVNVLWEYNMNTRIQSMVGIEATCPQCGLTLHYQAVKDEKTDDMMHQHLMQVNGWTLAEVEAHLAEATAKYEVRSAVAWTMDASWLWTHYTISDTSKARLLRGIRTVDERREARLAKKLSKQVV
jgi:hypothetical protein